ncbi:MAG TPA: hypothetical protein VFE47_04085 [Tepidisphaeraceae bacterium]|jgi:hypothetical protein|nr:hypothetical protein [Tepidisphaeraceae bacterium]
MGRVTLELSDNRIERARARAGTVGLTSAEAYLQEVLESDLDDETFEIVNRIGPPPELRVDSAESLERLKELLLESLNSPSRVMTPEDFAKRRVELIRRFSTREK